MALIMTEERCPQCGQIIYMATHPKMNNDGDIIFHQIDGQDMVHGIVDGVYLDRNNILWVVMFDDETKAPDYCCIHCGWSS